MMGFTACVLPVIILCAKSAGSYMETTWAQQGSLQSAKQPSHFDKKPVPTLSYDYLPQTPRLRHQSNSHWKERQGSFYVAQPVLEVDSSDHQKVSASDIISSSERMSKIPTTGVFRTYGRGRAVVPYKGATFHVPRAFGPQKAYRGMISARVFEPEKNVEVDTISRWRRDCASCPKDEMVIASKGNAFVLLPDPCSARWQPISGPKPGSKLYEGIHYITGTIGYHRGSVCQYKFEVEVRHCPPIATRDVNVSCSADNAWGSQCNFTCPPKMRLQGASMIECNDNLAWSEAEPHCINNYDCDVPNIEEGMTINCQTNELTDINNDYLSEGSYCKINNNGKETGMKCKRGEWIAVPHDRRKKHRNKNKSTKKRKLITESACRRNPCFHGGTCFQSIRDVTSYFCGCPSFTEGTNCEFKQCDTNPCLNGGKCLELNGETNCFCSANYTGERCEKLQNSN